MKNSTSKKLSKLWFSGIAVGLAVVTGGVFALRGGGKQEIEVRTALLETPLQNTDYGDEEQEDVFDYTSYFIEGESSIDYSESENKVRFIGKTDHNPDLEGVSTCNEIEEPSNPAIDPYDVYDCSFDMNTMIFEFMITNGSEVIDTETEEAFVDNYGRLDILLFDEDERVGILSDFTEEYREMLNEEDQAQFDADYIEAYNSARPCYLSYYKEASHLREMVAEEQIDNLFWGLFVKIFVVAVITIVIVAETAEQIRAEKNYKYNKTLDAQYGVMGNSGEYIADQYNLEEYCFGFKQFANYGCEVVAGYNLMVALERKEPLSKVIYDFEKWCLEFSVGLGALGSDPCQFFRYLKRKKVLNSGGFRNFSDFKNRVESESEGIHILMSRWNPNPLRKGFHTFYVYKEANDDYKSYNWNGTVDDCNETDLGELYKSVNDISKLNDGTGFIIGYVIYGNEEE